MITSITGDVDVVNKRVTIYTENLASYIEILNKRLIENAEELTEFIGEKSKTMDLPIPFKIEDVFEEYHTASLGAIVYSSIMKLNNEMRDAPVKKINDAVVEYLGLPSRNSGMKGHAQPGTQDTSFGEEQLELFNEVADYLDVNGYEIPYLKRAGKPSYKIIACIAIIYAGRELKEKSRESTG